MNRSLAALCALALAAAPPAAAESAFAVAEVTIAFGGESLDSFTIHAGGDMEPGTLEFEGFATTANGDSTDVLVLLDRGNLEAAPTVQEWADQGLTTPAGFEGQQATILSNVERSYEFPGALVSRSITTMYLNETNSFATLSVTDDPVPAIAWLTFAALVSATGLAGYALTICERRTAIVIGTEMSESGLNTRTEIVCERDLER